METRQRKPTETPAGLAIRTAAHISRGVVFCLLLVTVLLSSYVLSCVTLLGSCHFLGDELGCLEYSAKNHTVHIGTPRFIVLPRCGIFTN